VSNKRHWSSLTEPALQQIQRKCAAHGWDGEGSVSVSGRTIQFAALLLDCLANTANDIPAPDVAPEGDDHISLSWQTDEDNMVWVSIGSQRTLNFAGQFGGEGAVHGWHRVPDDSPGAFASAAEDIVRYVGRLAGSATNPPVT
jgi:hypothetical protein